MTGTERYILPKVTVITVCLNAREALKKTMINVAIQRYPRLQYIVKDGGSEDGTAELLKTLAGQNEKWMSCSDDGIYDAMNQAVGEAEGEWIIFMNAGDTFASDDVLTRIFATERQADIIYGDVIKNEKVCKAEAPHNAHRMFFCHQSALVKTSLLKRIPFDTRHRMSADFKFFKQAYHQGARFACVGFPIARFDTSGVSNTRRSEGLLDNIRVVMEVDSRADRLRFLPRLWFVFLLCKLRRR